MVSGSRLRGLISAFLVAFGLLMGLLAGAATRHPAAALPMTATAVAVAAAAWTTAGRPLPGRLALGTVQVTGVVAYMGTLFLESGRNPVTMAFAFAYLAPVLLLLVRSRIDASPRPVVEYAPVVAAGAATAMTLGQFVAEAGDVSVLRFGGLYLLLAVLVSVGAVAAGPARFATGLLCTTLSATLLYFVAITGQGWAAVAFGAVFLAASVAAVGTGRKLRSGEPGDAGQVVR